ncbi:hypothetical protein WN48_01184 [Eufriesea mexicana]|uniref:uncharacterized protein LOC108555546 n=1 Tax=Eufriesea mexicana TaxID=516756 RepID=UPI00083C8A4A|nr:PREDICTED: uncharacterized protein LOC108555546 [Eufriesea mexicana]OAD61116.1 hypothetical protein WN48_01184 [Eufriesea mexicana]
MNDSFLEDLKLVSTDVKTSNTYSVDRHVTTRHATSSPLQHLPQNKGDNVQNIHVEKQFKVKELSTKELKKIRQDLKKMQFEQDTKKQQLRARISEKKERSVETKLKPIENKVKSDGKEQEIKDDTKTKTKDVRVKFSESKTVGKDRIHHSGNYKENAQTSDVSVKENNRPLDYLKEGTSQMDTCKEKTKVYDTHIKMESKETDPVALLNAIKDIVSTCTKDESTKILRAMQGLHFNSQANFLKHLLCQTDIIINEMHPSNESNTVKNLVEQNARLQEDIAILSKKNLELQKKLEEFEFLKQENIALKMKCKELSKQ